MKHKLISISQIKPDHTQLYAWEPPKPQTKTQLQKLNTWSLSRKTLAPTKVKHQRFRGRYPEPTGQHESSSKGTTFGARQKLPAQFNSGHLISPTNMGTKYVSFYYGENGDSLAPFQMSSVSGHTTQTFGGDDVFTR